MLEFPGSQNTCAILMIIRIKLPYKLVHQLNYNIWNYTKHKNLSVCYNCGYLDDRSLLSFRGSSEDVWRSFELLINELPYCTLCTDLLAQVNFYFFYFIYKQLKIEPTTVVIVSRSTKQSWKVLYYRVKFHSECLKNCL